MRKCVHCVREVPLFFSWLIWKVSRHNYKPQPFIHFNFFFYFSSNENSLTLLNSFFCCCLTWIFENSVSKLWSLTAIFKWYFSGLEGHWFLKLWLCFPPESGISWYWGRLLCDLCKCQHVEKSASRWQQYPKFDRKSLEGPRNRLIFGQENEKKKKKEKKKQTASGSSRTHVADKK